MAVAGNATAKQKFHVEIIKPNRYDDDGYVVQWARAYIPSNSLGCVYGLVMDVQRRGSLGDDVELVVNAYDESYSIISTRKIINRIHRNGGRGIVLFAGVQTNQFPRAADLAREFRAAGIQVAIGGFHVSCCLSMLPELPDDITDVQKEGVAIFAGEAEDRIDEVLRDAIDDHLKPLYNYLPQLPDLQGQPTPRLSKPMARQYRRLASFDVGRGCPFQCSFCTIINVHGRKSRYRTADDVEQMLRTYVGLGIKRFFITDDNFARNKNWEAIFDRLIYMREEEGWNVKFIIQVDTMCHKIPNFIEKAARAGCNRIFVGMESVNPESLKAAQKHQNRITEYRNMLQQWRAHGVLTYAGYILGLPADTAESIERDIKLMQRELPIDIVEFAIWTPLPGSQDHRELYDKGVWMDPDMNQYDTEHVTTEHPLMSAEEWFDIYDRAWDLYYSKEHVQTMLRRAEVNGAGAKRLANTIMQYYGSYRFQHVHPLQSGILRRKVRTSRRPDRPIEHPLIFYPRRIWETLVMVWKGGFYYLGLQIARKRAEWNRRAKEYMDLALTPVNAELEESLEVHELNEALVQSRRARAKQQAGCGVKEPVDLVQLTRSA